MTHGSLFSGIGGFDLAAEWMGWENKFHCEWNPFGQKVLHHYWPNTEQFTDITKSNFKKYAQTIDIITGGFPCQPYSSAGKRLGKDDARHLWPEMLRVIREVQPRYIVGENVRGLTNWNGVMVFDEVQADLEAIGYEVLPFLLPACAVNAPHRRDRIWFIAYSNNTRTNVRMRNNREWKKENKEWERQSFSEYWKNGINGNASNSYFNGFNECNGKNEVNTSETRVDAFCNSDESIINGDASDTISIRGWQDEWKRKGKSNVNDKISSTRNWEKFPTVSPICNGDDGISERLDGITFSKWRNESIKAGGNAIVPQVAFQIFKAIEQYERIRHPTSSHPIL